MYTCARCGVKACLGPDHQKSPKNCPMREEERCLSLLEEYQKPEHHDFYVGSSQLEAIGYGKWPRLKETAEFCVRMGYRKVGLAFCMGLAKEAAVIDQVLRSYGLDVVSVICKAGGISKERAGVAEEHKLQPGRYEAMCNPIAQADLLGGEKTEFNIVVGLCVGHDSLFFQHSQAPCTVLIAKDRLLAHNPAGAVYCAEGYYKTKLAPDEQA